MAYALADKLAQTLAELKDEYLAGHHMSWILAYSAGKDSTLLAHLVVEMLLSLPPSARKRHIYLVGNDTLVESPLLATHQRASMAKIERAAESLRIPVSCHITTPAPDQTFWVNVIGRGYRPPTRTFRWCTDRMKIAPTSNFVKKQVSESGRVVLLIGVRSAESQARAASVAKHGSERLNPHSDMKGCMVFRPIKDWTTDEVWETLLQRPAPWGGRHRELVTLYRNAQAGECPLVVDRDQAPSCGTNSSRFGCWTCTVVDKDKSGQAMADNGIEEYEPLLEFRDWLRTLQQDTSLRQLERRDGTVRYREDGSLMRGPFTLKVRDEILTSLLALQTKIGRELISDDEVNIIKRIWAEDAVAMVRRRSAAADAAAAWEAQQTEMVLE